MRGMTAAELMAEALTLLEDATNGDEKARAILNRLLDGVK